LDSEFKLKNGCQGEAELNLAILLKCGMGRIKLVCVGKVIKSLILRVRKKKFLVKVLIRF